MITERLPRRSRLMLGVALIAGLAAFTWPLFISVGAVTYTTQAPLVFVLVLPLVLAVVIADLTSGGMDPKALAMLGVLGAVGAILRPLGTGVAGMEPIFFLIIVGGRVFGPAFGFAQGALTMATSALLTGGVGAWLPYQMIAAGFVGLGAGLLPRASGRLETALLAGYGLITGFAFGWLMDFAFWPFALGPATDLSFAPGAPITENLHRFVLYNMATSMIWNLGRSLTTLVLLLLLGPALLRILRRTARRAQFAES